MGKVIKGSADGQRYTLAVPAFAVPRAPGEPDDLESLGALGEPAPPDEPAIDLEAIGAQAQAIVDEAERGAQALLADAEDRVRVIIADAETRAVAIADDARHAARGEGFTAGKLEAQAAVSGMIDTMRELLESARSERHVLIEAAEPELVKLAVGIAERVLHQQIALDGGVVVEMAKAAISRIVDREKITVRVNPADVERMREHRDELLSLGDVKTMRVIEDQRVDCGGVILETDAGTIDAKISTQLAEARKILHIVDDLVVIPPADKAAGADDGETPLRAARAS